VLPDSGELFAPRARSSRRTAASRDDGDGGAESAEVLAERRQAAQAQHTLQDLRSRGVDVQI
jgi:hypothetical protein